MEVSCQLHEPAALPLGKSSGYPLDMRMGRPQTRSGRGGKGKKPSPCRELNPGRPARNLVCIVTKLLRLWFERYLK